MPVPRFDLLCECGVSFNIGGHIFNDLEFPRVFGMQLIYCRCGLGAADSGIDKGVIVFFQNVSDKAQP